jgi:hypothetical protein
MGSTKLDLGSPLIFSRVTDLPVAINIWKRKREDYDEGLMGDLPLAVSEKAVPISSDLTRP